MKTCLKLEDLSLEQKIGMVLTARNAGYSPEDRAYILDKIKNHALGAIQIDCTEANMPVLEEIKVLADYPLLIGCDMERGFPLADTEIPGNMALGAVDSVEDVYTFAYLTGKLAKEKGYSMIWSPVVDCAEKDEPNIVTRSFGADRDKIFAYAKAYLRAFSDCGIIGSVKHYPSCTDGHLDTHMAEETSADTQEVLEKVKLQVYRRLIEELGEDMMGIMVGHTRCTQIDPEYPATLSEKVLSIVRNMGFEGLMITDSFAMVGLIQNFGDENILGMAIKAGNDLILPNYRISFRQSYEYLLQNFKDGMFSMERLDEAVSRVLKAQERSLRQPEDFAVTQEEKEMLRRVYDNCICEIRAPGIPTALDTAGKHLFVVVCENMYEDSDNTVVGEIAFSKWWEPKRIETELKKRYPHSETVLVCEFPSVRQVENVCISSTRCDDVVYLTFCDSLCYQGTDGLTERMRVLIESTGVKNAAVLHFGNPYAMKKLVPVPRLIMGFPHPRCVDVALDILAGEKEAKGVLPVDIGK